MSIQCDLKDRFGDDLIFIEPDEFNEAILGVTHDLRVMYDAGVCLSILMELYQIDDLDEGHKVLDTVMETSLRSKKISPTFTWIDWDILDSNTYED